MAEQTAIEWCDSTFNPWIGCTKVAPACDDCYAARSTPARTLGVVWGPGQPRRRTADSTWELPRRWQRDAAAFQAQHGRRRRVFCASLADVFDNDVPPIWRADLFSLIKATPDLDWLLLTKRIGNAWKMMADACGVSQASLSLPLPNVWLGATVVNQAEADRDVPKLLRVPAAVRFLSVEPMLGSVWVPKWFKPGCARHGASFEADGKCEVCEGRGIWSIEDQLDETEKAPMHTGLHWVICGGESGPKARPMHPDWARSLRDQCAAAGIPFLFKQWGEWAPDQELLRHDVADWSAQSCTVRMGKKAAGRLLDGRTHDEVPHG